MKHEEPRNLPIFQGGARKNAPNTMKDALVIIRDASVQSPPHLLGHRRYLLQIAAGPRSDLSIPKNDLLRSPAAQRTHHSCENLLAGNEGGVVSWDEPGQTSGLPPRDERYFLDGIMA